MIATAPGKVLWAGEYAILEGYPAVITAVDRRVVATLAPAPVELSPFLAAVRDRVPAAAAARAARIVVDSSALAAGGHKLGLGSSAAATVAATALALGAIDDVHAIAHAAHAAAQAPRGARGSGADIAASVFGGTLLLRREGDGPLAVTRLPDPGVAWGLVWTGIPADTPSLVARTRAFRDRDPGGYDEAMAALGAAADALRAALVDPDATVGAVRRGAAALSDLADRSGAPLVPVSLRDLDARAARLGGAVKPTGAGGGDLLLAVFPTSRHLIDFLAETSSLTTITPRVESKGVDLALTSESGYT